MADTPEVKVKKALKTLYKDLGVLCVQPIGTVFTQSGVHDHILCVRGVFVSVEVKAGRGKMTPAQVEFGRRVRLAGGFAVCVNEHGIETFSRALRGLMQPTQSVAWRAAVALLKQVAENTFPYENSDNKED